MGWYFGSHSKQAQIDELIAGREEDGRVFRTLVHTLRGNTLWAVHENVAHGQAAQRFIGCYLLAYDRRDQTWGYKPMDETMGPVEVSCPLKYLNLAQPLPESRYAVEWRQRVRDHHKSAAQRREAFKSFVVGARVRLKNGITVAGRPVTEAVIESISPFRILFDGMLVRCKRTHVTEVLAEAGQP